MGFNYFGQGNIRDCSIENGRIIVTDPFGRVKTYETGLPENIERQCNLFWNKDIAFLLYTNDKREVIGRLDGSISIYKGDLLVGLNWWRVPPMPLFIHVGYRHSIHQVRLYLDFEDMQTLFADFIREETLLPNPLKEEVDLSGCLAALGRKDETQCILLKGGRRVEIPVWSVQNKLRIGTCRSII